MRRRKQTKKFDWYGISQRFSLRKYHFGAASVLLGAALVFGSSATVSATETQVSNASAGVQLVTNNSVNGQKLIIKGELVNASDITIDGFSVKDPQITNKQNGNSTQVKIDPNKDAYTFAVVENFTGIYYDANTKTFTTNKISGGGIQQIVFSTPRTDPTSVTITLIENSGKVLYSHTLKPGETNQLGGNSYKFQYDDKGEWVGIVNKVDDKVGFEELYTLNRSLLTKRTKNYSGQGWVMPKKVTQVTKLVDEKTGNLIGTISQTGLSGQHYTTKAPTIKGYTYVNKEGDETGKFSPFKEGYETSVNLGGDVTVAYKQLDDAGTMKYRLTLSNGETAEGTIQANSESASHSYKQVNFQILNPYIPETKEVTYYYKRTGPLSYGWVKNANGTWSYYDTKTGELAKSKWVGNYWLEANGIMATSKWVDNDRYYVDADGKWVKGKQRENNRNSANSSELPPSPKAVPTQKGWVKTEDGKWTFYDKTTGVQAKNKWVGHYWLDENGIMATGKWVDNNRYYVDANGKWVKDYKENK